MTNEIVGFVICLLTAIGFVVIGIVFWKGNLNLLAGYNTASRRQRKKYNQRAIGRFMALVMLVLAAGVSLMGANVFWQNQDLQIGLILLILLVVIFSVIYINTSRRFK